MANQKKSPGFAGFFVAPYKRQDLREREEWAPRDMTIRTKLNHQKYQEQQQGSEMVLPLPD
jgi:hypothetical protein